MQGQSVLRFSVIFLVSISVLFLVSCSPGVGNQADNANSSESSSVTTTQSSEESGKFFFNEDNVACLAQVDFQAVRNEDNGTIVITVPYDDYTARALGTTRTYVAVTKQGERFPEPDERLGTVEIDGVNEVDALRLESAQVIDGGSTIEFKGYVAGPKDLDSLLYSTGPITGSISDEEMRQAWDQMKQELEAQSQGKDLEVAIVDLPELNAETADIWAASIDGELEMVLHSWSETSERIADDDSNPSWITKSFVYDYSKYKGYFEDYKPLSDPSQPTYKDFSARTFFDSWVIDGAGLLLYIDQDGSQWFFPSSYYAIGDKAFT